MTRDSISILIGGEAGQGLNTINDILCRALVRHGYSIVMEQDYMSRVRGGHNTFTVRVSPTEILAAIEPVDLIIALNKETVDLHQKDLTDKGLVLVDAEIETGEGSFVKVPYDDLAEKKNQNVAALGVVGQLLGLDSETCAQAVKDQFGDKGEKVAEKNDKALDEGYRWAQENAGSSKIGLKKMSEPEKLLMMDGNQAIAMGAVTAGLKFYSFYPMTPSTSVALTLAAQMEKLPIVVEQCEDEISVINMALGASYAGVPAMCGTSGGGFALMSETLSMVAASETPLAMVLAQRGGPATGLPTRTEQGDLEFALYAGHGEFPRAILAPGTVEQCFWAGRRAIELAEASQGPVIIMTDQFLAESLRSVRPLLIEELTPIKVGADPDEVETPYQRYRFTESGVSPRLIPGKSEHLVVGDSHEHYESGHICEEAEVRTKMVDKRMKKLEVLKKEFIPPDYYGDDNPEILLMCWGSTVGAAREAVEEVQADGTKAAVLHFSQVWPLVPEKFMDKLEAATEVIAVEQNAKSQFAGLIKKETGFEIKRSINKYDGRPITPEYILREMGSA